MLRKFSVKNFKSFNQTFVLDLTQTKSYEFNQQCIVDGTVSKAIIYGPNGCGKSNLALAMFELETHLTDHKIEQAYQHHYLNAVCTTELAEFEYTFDFDGVIVAYRYGKTSATNLVYENLTVNDKAILSIDRRKNAIAFIDLKGAETLNRDLTNSNISLVKYVHNNAILTTEGEDIIYSSSLKTFISFASSMVLNDTIEDPKIKEANNSTELYKAIIEKTSGDITEFEQFLNELGVKCKLVVNDLTDRESISFNHGGKKIDFLQTASSGTLSLFLLYFAILSLKDDSNIKFLCIDEFDAHYHHKAAKMIVQKLKETNCQVILTTHNTSIMTNDLLRPDCYFIMDDDNVKPIYQFTDKELRKAHNIEKMYKAGAFS